MLYDFQCPFLPFQHNMDSGNVKPDYEKNEVRIVSKDKSTVTILENKLNDVLSKYENLLKQKDRILSSLGVQMRSIKYETESFRKMIMEELDWHLSKICDNCSTNVSVLEENVVGTWCSRLKGMEKELEQLQRQISDIKQNEGKIDLQRIELDIKLKCKALSEMDDVFEHQFGLRMSFTPNFKSVLIRLSSALTDLTIDQNILLNKEDRKISPGAAILLKSFEKIIAIDIQRQFQTTDLRGCTIVSGMLVFSDYESNQLLVYSREGLFQRIIKLKGKPFCVTSVESGKVAFTLLDLKCVEIYDLESDYVCQVFELDKTCAGISYSKGKLIVRVEGIGYYIFDVCSGEHVREIRIDGKNMPYVTYIDGRLYYTNWYTGKVICSDLNGKPWWEFKNETLQTPNGITTDAFGNVFVSGFSSNNIVVISKDGLSARSINFDVSLTNPIGIYYENETNELLVSSATGQVILYKVKSF